MEDLDGSAGTYVELYEYESSFVLGTEWANNWKQGVSSVWAREDLDEVCRAQSHGAVLLGNAQVCELQGGYGLELAMAYAISPVKHSLIHISNDIHKFEAGGK